MLNLGRALLDLPETPPPPARPVDGVIFDSAEGLRLSVIVPAYNEARTIRETLDRLAAVPAVWEVVVVDDGSTDGTREILARRAGVTFIAHLRNSGKGAAVRTGLGRVTGDVVVVQDADAEYDPRDLSRLHERMQAGAAAVYGSRCLHRPDSPRWHTLGNRFLTFLSNLLLGQHLTDMETCYKMLRVDLARRLPLTCRGFGFEPEVTAALAARGVRIVEVPIRYRHRTYSEGKKIGWRDAFRALAVLLHRRIGR